jgi:hypothetical protein
MSVSQNDQPNKPAPHKSSLAATENFDGVYVYVDAVGDQTIRPARPEVRKHLRPITPNDSADEKV